MDPLELSQVLAFKPTLRVERMETGAIFLIGERERFVLSGDCTAEVTALVDGRRTVGEILRAAAGRFSEPEALYTLSRLAARGYLVPATPELPSERAAFWHGVGLDGKAAAEALSRTPVSVLAVGEAAFAGWMTEALEQAGVRIDGDAAVKVVVTDDPLRPELASINLRALREGSPWIWPRSSSPRTRWSGGPSARRAEIRREWRPSASARSNCSRSRRRISRTADIAGKTRGGPTSAIGTSSARSRAP